MLHRCRLNFFFITLTMAKVQYSALVTQMRGKFNGSQLSVNRSGNILQVKCPQRRGATPGQAIARSGFSYCSRYWRSLSPSDQAANAANAVNYPYVDKFGNTRYYTGYQLLLRSNLNLNQSGLPLISVVPATPPVAPSVTITLVTGSVPVGDPPDSSWQWVWAGGSPGQYAAQFYYSPPFSTGINVFTGKFLYAGYVDLDADFFGVDGVSIPYVNQWQVGLKVASKMSIVDVASGVEVAYFINYFIISS